MAIQEVDVITRVKNNNSEYIAYPATRAENAMYDNETSGLTADNVQDAIDEQHNNIDSHAGNKNNPHSVTKSQIGLGNVPNVTTNNQTATYTKASTLANLVSGETLSAAFGKIAKAITDLISHMGNKSNPHSVTKAQIGLGNVNNTSDANKPISTAAQTALDKKADLGSDGKIPASQLPSFVDDVLEYTSKSNFPATGETGKIYIDTTSNLTYRWSGSTYVEISSSLALGETASTAYRGDRGKIAYDHTTNKNNPHSITKSQIGLSNVDNTSDANKPISTATQAALNKKANIDSPAFTGAPTVPTPTTASGIANKSYVDTVISGSSITEITGTSPITISKSGTNRAIAHGNSGVTAGSYGPSANATPGFGATFNVPQITVDAKGHATSSATRTVKIPNTAATQSAAGLMSAADKKKIDGTLKVGRVTGTISASGTSVTITMPNASCEPIAVSAYPASELDPVFIDWWPDGDGDVICSIAEAYGENIFVQAFYMDLG